MTPNEAEKVFEAHGVDTSRLDPTTLHRAWIRVARTVHPDSGGGHDQAAVLNAAYSVLRERVRTAPPRPGATPHSRPGFQDPKRDGVAVWAWAGAHRLPLSDRIERADYSDRNFVKRRLWALSEGGTDEWTIWPFDGQGFLTPLTVYASADLFGEMARAAQAFAREGFRRPVAVLATRGLDRFAAWLIGWKGAPLLRPERFSVSGDPASDPVLIRSLKTRLEA